MSAENVAQLWPILTALVGLVAWAVRLEARGVGNERRIGQLESQSGELGKKLDGELVQIRERLVRIETLLTAATDIHKDVRR